jgi:hypothetical protein
MKAATRAKTALMMAAMRHVVLFLGHVFPHDGGHRTRLGIKGIAKARIMTNSCMTTDNLVYCDMFNLWTRENIWSEVNIDL